MRCPIHDKVYTETCDLCDKGQGPAENLPPKKTPSGQIIEPETAKRQPVPVRQGPALPSAPGRKVISRG
jgi:hypothetical protein